MIQRVVAGALGALFIAAFGGSVGISPAAACNRMDGCVHDFQNENYDMMHDGRMDGMMHSGAANIEAFRSPGAAARPQESAPRPALGRPRRRP